MTSKYAEDIATIKERTEHIVKHLETLNDSQEKQWKAINKNALNIRELKTRVNYLAGLHTFVSAGLASIAGWFGSQR